MSAWWDAGFLLIIPVHMFDQGIPEAEKTHLTGSPCCVHSARGVMNTVS